MKKAACIFMTLLLGVPFFVGAVTWTGNSNQFRWIGSGVKNDMLVNASEVSLQCTPDFTQGTMTISYTLPAAVKSAKLVIYSISGVHIQDFDLKSGSAAVRWNFAKAKVAAGVYVASLRYGEVEKNIQMSIVK